jgi:uncharacterized protein (TIGR02118 family)
VAETNTPVKVLILFGKPVDEDLFGRHFESVHLKLLDDLEGVRQRSVNHVAGSVTGDSPFHLLVELQFVTEADMQHALNSAAGQTMARDFTNFASGGVSVLLCRSDDTIPD